MRQCRICGKNLYKDYRQVEILDSKYLLCAGCGVVSFKPWPSETEVQGRLMSLSRRRRGNGRGKTLTVHVDKDPGAVVELRGLGFGKIPGIPQGSTSSAKVLKVRAMLTPKPPRKKKPAQKAAAEKAEAAPAEPVAAKPRVKRKIEGYSIYACM